MMIAFSLTNRLRLGQAKGGLGFNPLRHCEEERSDDEAISALCWRLLRYRSQ